MLIHNNSRYLLKKVLAKSKMFEYNVPSEEHIEVEYMAQELLILAIATIGDSSNYIWNNRNTSKISTLNDNLIQNLNFTSIYFDSLITSKIGETNYDDYYTLLGAISFYLSDSLGSAKVMLNKLDWEIDLEVNQIDKFLIYLLADKLDELKDFKFSNEYLTYFNSLIKNYSQFYSAGEIYDFVALENFKNVLYLKGNSREILLGDALIAIFIKKYTNSALNLLPFFSNTLTSDWEPLLLKHNSIKELWPSQIKLGQMNIFNGASGVIQMPTSSGKTTSIGLIIRSSFLSQRTKLAVVVAPFKALCKEITFNLMDFFQNEEVSINELSDIAEKKDSDFFWDTENRNTLIVLTPEKLLFLIRNNNDILNELNLIIFDEAHLFDDSSRGTNYELLISTIKYYLKPNSQKILISAVIENSAIINEWLNGSSGVNILNNEIISSQRSIAMGDWVGHTGQLYFLNQDNPDIDDFYVPRIVDIQEIKKHGNERKKRFFPDVNFDRQIINKSYDMQIYYALKMIHNGATAIFAGTKDGADNTLKRILELNMRGVDTSAFIEDIVQEENIKIAHLIELNLGLENVYYSAALNGVFVHHGRIPIGIRLSIEYAMSHELIKCIVCTSTLAQGVNLPIKYLIISNLYQGKTKIKVRDFHNLIGRTGRAGKHLEGTIILSEPFVHSKKHNWKWQEYKKILDVNNLEESISNLLKIVRPIVVKKLPPLTLWKIILLKYSDLVEFNNQINSLKKVVQSKYSESFSAFTHELKIILASLNDIENYIMYFLNNDTENETDFTIAVTTQTLGYHLASPEEKEKLIHLFNIIKNCSNSLSKNELNLYSVASLGFENSKILLDWISESFKIINNVSSESELLNIIFPQIITFSDNKMITSISDLSIIQFVCELWIEGLSYYEILQHCQNKEFRITKRGKEVNFTIQDVIELCDNILGYSTILPLNGVFTFINNIDENHISIPLIKSLQNKIRYGLPDSLSIFIFELGFSDRVVSQIIAKIIYEFNYQPITSINKIRTRRLIRQNRQQIENALQNFPGYFLGILEKICSTATA